MGRQVQAPRPRALGKWAVEGRNDRLQADLIDFSQNTRGKTKYVLVVMDVFTREAAAEPLQNKNAEGHKGTTRTAWTRRTWATSLPRWTGSCPMRRCTAPSYQGGPQRRPVEQPLQAGRVGLQRAPPRDGARRPGERRETAGHRVQGVARQRRQVPAEQGLDEPAHEGFGGRGGVSGARQRITKHKSLCLVLI